MTPDQIRSTLSVWQKTMQECDGRMDQLAELTGVADESPLIEAVYSVMGRYTTAIADLIGWDDETLSAWWIDHHFGEKPMGIGFPGEELRTIADIDVLADFIVEDLARAES